jgi:release factor glutamine methyltransferase
MRKPFRQMHHLPITIGSAVTKATDELTTISDSPRLDAEALLAWTLGVSRSYVLAHSGKAMNEQETIAFNDAIARRRTGEPVAYITGTKEFWSMELKVTPAVLVPRPETELLVEKALELIPQGKAYRVLDLGTGSGAIAIAIAGERKECEIVATDWSRDALDVAAQNAATHNIRNIRFGHGSWIEPVGDQKFDLVVTNPPYVRKDDPALEKLGFEPRTALEAGTEGMDAISLIVEKAKTVLTSHGSLLIEHGGDQQESVATALRNEGWSDIVCFRDLAGQPRVTGARMNDSSRQDPV